MRCPRGWRRRQNNQRCVAASERTVEERASEGRRFKWPQMHSHLRILRGHLEPRKEGGAEQRTRARVWRLFVSSFACLSDKRDAANGLTGENDKKEAWTHGTSINGRDHYEYMYMAGLTVRWRVTRWFHASLTRTWCEIRALLVLLKIWHHCL